MLRRQKMTNRSIFYSDEENARTCAGAFDDRYQIEMRYANLDLR